jgi:hypothetical protein
MQQEFRGFLFYGDRQIILSLCSESVKKLSEITHETVPRQTGHEKEINARNSIAR